MIRKLLKVGTSLLQRDFYGFLSPSVRLCREDIDILDRMIDVPDYVVVDNYEKELADFLGEGDVVTFASGRMAFYAILSTLNLQSDDEVILTGFTCSVMVNAVLRTGAKIIYSDIDEKTFGMSAMVVETKITDKTKVIVAQHSFGIPCEIDKIAKIAMEKQIFLVEDCALTFGSSYKGIMCGNWGDAAIFSTDHTKPLNTLIGGFLYTKNISLLNKIRILRNDTGYLDKAHQHIILKQYICENNYEHLSHKLFYIQGYLNVFLRKLHLKKDISPYLLGDSTPCVISNSYYPYPAQLPSFLAYIGRLSLKAYKESIEKRKQVLSMYKKLLSEKEVLPTMLFDDKADIVPLRIPFVLQKKKYGDFSFIDDWIWFKQPIVATSESLDAFGYKEGDCPVSERIGLDIMNFPILMDENKAKKIYSLINKIYYD